MQLYFKAYFANFRTPPLQIIIAQSLKSPEGDLRQKKKKPFPFYSSGRSHEIARVIKLEDFLVMISL